MREVKRLLVRRENEKEYAAAGGWNGLQCAREHPEQVIEILRKSGLVGRSGSGFPVWKKWEMTRSISERHKYIVCNADEGEPATCKDRVLLETNPYLVIEGMAIAAIAVGANKGYLYLRAEYASLRPRIVSAIEETRRAGWLGLWFDVELRSGAGSYLCGEETALLNSLEGRRGETRLKPPYPGEMGLWGLPTIVNNVETLANVPLILAHGVERFRSVGTSDYPGTKLITLSGYVSAPGVYEIPVGLTVRELWRMGGGAPDERSLKAVQTGGQSGTILPMEMVLDRRFSPKEMGDIGACFGTGALMFIPSSESIAELLENELSFFASESCGRCVPCRIGLQKLKEIVAGLQHHPDACSAEEAKRLASYICRCARCALGTAAVAPVLSAFRYFDDELSGEEMRAGGDSSVKY